jgi:hypothetical protein
MHALKDYGAGEHPLKAQPHKDKKLMLSLLIAKE